MEGNYPKILIGENRVQELVGKSPDYLPLVENKTIDLHLIGPLQRNKINAVLATPISTIQSIDTFELANAISERVLKSDLPWFRDAASGSARLGSTGPTTDGVSSTDGALSVMLQVNVSGEATKSGTDPERALELASQIAELSGLKLTGFMCLGLPPVIQDNEIINSEQILAGYRILAEIRDATLNSGLETATELSMGMSTDLELAIAAGATIVRVGTAIFGRRAYL